MNKGTVKVKPISERNGSYPMTSVLSMKMEPYDNDIIIKEEDVGRSPNITYSMEINDGDLKAPQADNSDDIISQYECMGVKVESSVQCASQIMNGDLKLNGACCVPQYGISENLGTEMQKLLGCDSNQAFPTMNVVSTREQEFRCLQCHAKFTCNALTEHACTHTGENAFICDECHVKFSTRGSHTRHMLTHTGTKTFSCDQCPAKYFQRQHLTSHKRMHTGERPFSCDQCNAKFTQRHHLTNHIRTHTGMKPFSCDQCHANFSDRGNLSRHMLTHTGEKPFSCGQCSATFARRQHLIIHIRTHTGERPYSCDQCLAKFNKKCGLVRHMRVHHRLL